MIYVCSLDEMRVHVAALRPARLVSLVPACEQPPTPAGFPAARHLRIEVDDISEPLPGRIVPAEQHVSVFLDFLRSADDWSEAAPLLLHCVAGISRSTAAALIALVHDTEGREREAARHLRACSPWALPNRRLIEVADALLGRAGRLIAARDEMGLPAEMGLAAPLARVPRRF